MTESLILPKGREGIPRKLLVFLESLPLDKAFEVIVRPYVRKRSEQQNRYLWGVCYATILREGGEALRGWRDTDLHEHFLGEWAGVERMEIGTSVYLRPRKRSSRLNKQEFSDYIAYLHQRAGELGIFIPDPDEYFAEAAQPEQSARASEEAAA